MTTIELQKTIEEALKSKHNFNTFRMLIQSKRKDEDRTNRDAVRQEVNPKVRKRDRYLCCFCNRNVLEVGGANTLHHKIPERYSGENTPENLITICANCHHLLEVYINIIEREAIKHALLYLSKLT